MTTIDSARRPASAPARHARRMTLTKLSRYDNRMLRNMGIDPQDVLEALAPLDSRGLAHFLNPLGRRRDR